MGSSNSTESESPAAAATQPPKPRSRRFLYALAALIGIVLLIAVLPWIVAHTPLRNVVVSRALKNPELRATVRQASFGWFSPLELSGLEILRADETIEVEIDRFSAEKSWLELWRTQPEIGQLEIERPQVRILLTKRAADQEPPETSSKLASQRPVFTAHVRDARFIVRSEAVNEPIIDLQPINVVALVERREQGRELTVEPMRILDRLPLSPELCDRGLQLVVPILSDAVRVEGEVSLELQRFHVPLDRGDAAEQARLVDIEGLVEFHQVSTGLKNPLLRDIAQLIAALFRVEAPRMMRLADNTTVHFHVRDGRVFHEGMAFALPEISPDLIIQTGGSVGLDETLDLELRINVPSALFKDRPRVRDVLEKASVIRVVGTVDQPKLSLPEGDGLVSTLGKLIKPSGENGEKVPVTDAILDVVGDLLKPSGKEPSEDSPSLLDLIRERRKARQEEEQRSDPSQRKETRGGLFRRRESEP